MKKTFFVSIVILLSVILSCKSKKEEDKTESFFPVLSFIQSQVADIDTSLYAIKQIIIIDSIHSDTTWIKREEFRGLAKDFLSLPDISSKKFKKLYTEEKSFDESMNRATFYYRPINPDKVEIQNQQVVITPDIAAGDKVRSIIIDWEIGNKDSSVQKRMLWQVDKSFQVTTIAQKPGQPETIHTMKVSWNEKEEE
jgi:hypothetical protein